MGMSTQRTNRRTRVAERLALAVLLNVGLAIAQAGPELDGTPALTAPPPAGQSGAMLILKPDEPQPLGDGRTIVLTDLVEKRLVPNRRSMMRARFTISGAGPDRAIELTSDEPCMSVDGVVLEYVGGWRSEAQLKVTFAADGRVPADGTGR